MLLLKKTLFFLTLVCNKSLLKDLDIICWTFAIFTKLQSNFFQLEKLVFLRWVTMTPFKGKKLRMFTFYDAGAIRLGKNLNLVSRDCNLWPLDLLANDGFLVNFELRSPLQWEIQRYYRPKETNWVIKQVVKVQFGSLTLTHSLAWPNRNTSSAHSCRSIHVVRPSQPHQAIMA